MVGVQIMYIQTSNDDLKKMYSRFNPNSALTSEELEDYYVNMDQNEIKVEELENSLVISYETRQPVKLLFMGHRGSGKSTALNYLVSLLNRERGTNFLIIYYDILELLDNNDIDYTDILFTILSKIMAEAKANGIEIKTSLVKSVPEWWNKTNIANIFDNSDENLNEIKFISYLFETLSRMKNESTARKEIRGGIQPRVTELITIINNVIEEVEKSEKQVLVIIDNLEKCNHSKTLELFHYNSSQLALPKCNIIYTFPISLRSSNHFIEIKSYFHDVIVYPNIPIYDIEGVLQINSRNFMKEVAEKRISLDLFTPDALEYIIEMSGGVLREYIRIIRASALRAISRKKSLIDKSIAVEIINENKDVYQHLLKLDSETCELLKEISETKYIGNDERLMGLLHDLCVLEYKDKTSWYDLNPIVRLILEENNIIEGR
ncbi:P-loop NTPase fold protein [Methanosarcina hadiensis]|uniref:P-loop NTPase fold protein n=1 Tax=Methanosarcina hadiensis TaxID=3078083 RepID=UPI003977C20D